MTQKKTEKNEILEYWFAGFNVKKTKRSKKFTALYLGGPDTADLLMALLKKVHAEVLHKDDNWHYFNEDAYVLIRFSKKFKKQMTEFVKENNLIHIQHLDGSLFKKWVDEQEITLKYQDVFAKMFHSFSELAVKGYEETEFSALLDRVIHCFINHQYVFLKEHRRRLGADMEPYMVVMNALSRARYIGGLQEARREKQKVKEATNG